MSARQFLKAELADLIEFSLANGMTTAEIVGVLDDQATDLKEFQKDFEARRKDRAMTNAFGKRRKSKDAS